MSSPRWVTAAFICSYARYCPWDDDSALYCLVPLLVAPPSQKQPHVCCFYVICWASFSGPDYTGGHLSDAFWDSPEILPHCSPLVIATQVAFGPCAFWLSKQPLSSLSFRQHLSFLLFRNPDSVWVTFCQLPNSRGGAELGPWPRAQLVSLCYLRMSVLIT